MSKSVDISALSAYIEKHEPELRALLSTGGETLGNINVVDVKSKLILHPLTIGSTLRDWDGEFTPVDDEIVIGKRTLTTHPFSVDYRIRPGEMHAKWMGEVMRRGANQDDLPFEQFLLEQIAIKVREILEDTYVMPGTGVGAYSMKGFLQVIIDEITATAITPVATGVLTAANAVDKIKEVFRALPKAYRKAETRCYVSYDVYDLYVDNYQTDHGALPYNREFDKLYVEGSANRCMIIPLASMGASQRVIITPQENMVFGTDLESDFNRIEVEKDHRNIDLMIDGIAGVQIADLRPLSVNDQT